MKKNLGFDWSWPSALIGGAVVAVLMAVLGRL